MVLAIILGNRMNDDGSLSELCKKRLELTLQLYAEKAPDKIVLSGGIANKKAGVAESHAMRDWLLKRGIPEQAFVVEDKSLTTKQNAQFSIPLAMKLGADTLYVCTSSEHMNRHYLNPYRLFAKQMKKRGCAAQLIPYTD